MLLMFYFNKLLYLLSLKIKINFCNNQRNPYVNCKIGQIRFKSLIVIICIHICTTLYRLNEAVSTYVWYSKLQKPRQTRRQRLLCGCGYVHSQTALYSILLKLQNQFTYHISNNVQSFLNIHITHETLQAVRSNNIK